ETEVQPKRWGASKKAAALEARLRQAPLTRDPAELRLRNACWAELAQHCARERSPRSRRARVCSQEQPWQGQPQGRASPTAEFARGKTRKTSTSTTILPVRSN